jgi:hypothetical protein
MGLVLELTDDDINASKANHRAPIRMPRLLSAMIDYHMAFINQKTT